MNSLKQSKILRDSFRRFGRAGLSERVIQLIKEFNEVGSYKGAIELAGRLRAIALAANADYYWGEKATAGFYLETEWLENHRAEVTKDPNGDCISVSFTVAHREVEK